VVAVAVAVVVGVVVGVGVVVVVAFAVEKEQLMNGKGSTQRRRQVDRDTWSENYEFEPEEVRSASGKSRAYGCAKCGQLYAARAGALGSDDGLKWAYTAARQCCGPRECDCCGVEIPPRREYCWMWCNSCRDKKGSEKLQLAFDKANKVSYQDYGDKPVVHCDDFYESIESLVDHLWCDGVEIPPWVWGCYEVQLKLDGDSLLENALEDFHEEAGDDISQQARDALQKMLDDWCENQGVTMFCEDPKTVVLLDGYPLPEEDEP
jgi:hypothetical protein